MEENKFNISEAEAEREAKIAKRSQMYANVKTKISGYQLDIESKIRQDNNHGTFISFIVASFYDNEVQFRMSQYGSHAASFKLHFARKDDITNYGRESKEFAIKNNIKLGDVYKFEGPGTGANLLEYVKKHNVVEYVDALRYFAVQFEERGELVQMIKGFYLEYFEDMKVIGEVETELSMLNYNIRNYYEALYTKEVVDGDYIKDGNVIVAHIKSSDFILFESLKIEKVARINITSSSEGLRFDNKYNFDKGDSRYYLRLDSGRFTNSNLKRDQIIRIIVSNKLAGDKVDIYTVDEYKDYCMLIETEKNNLLTNKDKYFTELSKKYEEIHRRK